jgi:transposase
MKTISNEKRCLLIAAKQRKEKISDIAKWLEISNDSVAKIWRKYKKTGDFLPIKNTGKKSSISDEKKEEICALIKKQPDITLAEIIEELSLPIQKSRLSKLLISLGYSYKKNYLPCGTISAKRSKKA